MDGGLLPPNPNPPTHPPTHPKVQDAYIDEVLRSGRAKWTYVCAGASETVVDSNPRPSLKSTKEGERAGGDFPLLPQCRGLLVFMDGEEEGEEVEAGSSSSKQERRRRRGAAAGEKEEKERPTHIVGGIMNRRPSSSSSTSQPGTHPPTHPSNQPPSTPLGDAAKRVGAFWANATDDFANKVSSSTHPLTLLPMKTVIH